jgi:hypothetical protein
VFGLLLSHIIRINRPLSLRERVRERGSNKKQLLDYISPLPIPPPEGEGVNGAAVCSGIKIIRAARHDSNVIFINGK